MTVFRYSRWDGSQIVDPFSVEDVMKQIAEQVLDDNADVRSILRRMLQRGTEFPGGQRMMGLQELLDRLRRARERHLQRYDIGSVLDDVKERLDQVVKTERDALERKLDEARGAQPPANETSGPRSPEGAGQDAGRPSAGRGSAGAAGSAGTTGDENQQLRQLLEQMARRRLSQLEQLPPEVGGRIQQLRDYDFLDPDARQQFQELLQMLQQQVLQNYFRGLQQGIQSLTPEALREIRDMVRDLNELLERHRRGDQPDISEFMRKWGKFFPPGIETAEQLAEYLQQQMQRMESLLNSMSPEMRKELEDLLQSVFQDGDLQAELSRLAGNMARMGFGGSEPGEFPFSGDEPLTLQEAMGLMGDMSSLDELERELLQSIKTNDVSRIDSDEIGRLLGEEAQALTEQMQSLTRMLEEAGLLRRKGNDWELTPRALHKIAEQALVDIFGRLDNGLLGNHELMRRGVGAERLDETKRYTFGDTLSLDANQTLMNAIFREAKSGSAPSGKLRLTTDDFEIYRTTAATRCSTVIMLDMSYSMMHGGRFQAGRRVALALDTLIRMKFPRDYLRVVAFSYFVLTLEPQMLLDSYWVEYGGGTNFQEALRQARVLLSRQKGGTKQIVMITDGEPNTYSYWSQHGDFDERNGRGPMAETLREVVRCTQDGIVINTFMMAREAMLTHFVRMMAKVNHGRAFFSSPQHLGAYVLLDYLGNKQRASR